MTTGWSRAWGHLPPFMTKLEALYDEYNELYFGGKLHKVSVRWSKKCTPTHSAEFLDYHNGKQEILFNFSLKPFDKYTKITLLHEMTHVKIGIRGQKDYHGSRWIEEMRRLASIGAFDELW